jgi:hypothetical protein
VCDETVCLNVTAYDAVAIFRMSAKCKGSVKMDVSKPQNPKACSRFYAHTETELSGNIFKSFCN